jgi:hypothetical protein
MDTLRELFDPEIVWHFPGRSPLAGDHRGTDVVLGFFGRTMELTAETLRAELHDVVADDRHTVGMHLGTGEREGRRFEDRGPGVPRPRRQSCGGVAVHRGPVHLRRVLLPGAAAAPRPLWYTVGTRPLGSLGALRASAVTSGLAEHQVNGAVRPQPGNPSRGGPEFESPHPLPPAFGSWPRSSRHRGRASPSGELGAIAARCKPRSSHRPCHPRAISSGHERSPAVTHGQSERTVRQDACP